MELLEVDRQILTVINLLRERHYACTGSAVSTYMKMSKSYIFGRLHLLNEARMVTFTAMPGSLRLVADVATGATESTFGTGNNDGAAIMHGEVHESTGPVTTPQARSAATRRANREAAQLRARERVTLQDDDS
jgi:hypothetical protein